MKKNTQSNKNLLIVLLVVSAIGYYCFYESVADLTTISIWITLFVAFVGLNLFYRRVKNEREKVKQMNQYAKQKQVDLQRANKNLLIVLLAVSAIGYYCFYESVADLTTISIWITLFVAFVGLNFFYRRVKNEREKVKQMNQYAKQKQVDLQREQTELQIVQLKDARFTAAVSLLDSSESSARTGAIYQLYSLAVDDKDKKYRKKIAQILCSHIRSKTQESDYRGKLKDDNHKERPSNEVQTCINLLFQRGSGGLYTKYAADLDEANLSHAYLVGANFSYAQCQGADFSEAQCQGADFKYAQCQGAVFSEAQCQGANFSDAQCQGARFSYAQCQSADFCDAKFQGAHFSEVQCQGADFSDAQCQGAHFSDAKCQGADFSRTQCQGANFSAAQCQGANFMRTNLKGAHTSPYSYGSLESQVNKDTELSHMVFVGRLEAGAIAQIKAAKKYIGDKKYEKLEEIIEANKVKKAHYNNMPKHIIAEVIAGVLEDSEEIQAIIAEDWDKLEELEKARNATKPRD